MFYDPTITDEVHPEGLAIPILESFRQSFVLRFSPFSPLR